jgi:hypothetical protein
MFLFYKGLILFFITFLILFFLVNLIEYKLFLSSEWRKLIFVTSVLFLSIVFVRYVLWTGIIATGIAGKLNNRKASLIIAGFLPEIKDKLLNIIELHDIQDKRASLEITEAAIVQKISDLKFLDFAKAINIKQLKGLAGYFIISFTIVGAIHLINSNIYLESANRLIHFNKEFVKPSPYDIIWINEIKEIEKGNSFKIRIECAGKEIPSVMYINIEGNGFIMNTVSDNLFEYELNAVINPVSFYFTDLRYKSVKYFLDVTPVPVINSFSALITVPSYTGLNNYSIENIGDINVPKGSRIKWNFGCFDTEALAVCFGGEDTLMAEKIGNNIFEFEKMILKGTGYDILIKRKGGSFQSAMNFRAEVIEDNFPEIRIQQVQDSSRLTRLFFRGTIHDDYGFSKLGFHINSEGMDTLLSLPFNRYVIPQEFYYSIDIRDFKQNSNVLHYYFSVADNDGINGPKITVSESFTFIFPGKDELENREKEDFKNIEELISESQRLSNEIKQDLKQLQIKNINNNVSDWEKSTGVENILNKKVELESILRQIEDSYKSMTGYQNTFNNQNDELVKKQEEIQKLLEDVMNDELKKLLDEFSELAKDFNDKRLNELSKQMDVSMEDLSKQLERNLQMLQRMKVENNLLGIIQEVENLEIELDVHSQEINNFIEEKEMINEIISDHKRLEDIEQKLNDILEDNRKLAKPLNFENFSEEFGDIKEDVRNSLNELQKGNRKNSSQRMKSAAEKLKNLAFGMQQMLNANTRQQNQENIQNLKQILKNIVALSFSQEDILRGMGTTAGNDPEMTTLIRKQRDLLIQSGVVRDSLYALAKRAPQIDNIVNNELMGMSVNLDRSAELVSEGLFSQAATNQQLVITSSNNLALLLSDILRQLENMSDNQDGEGDDMQPGAGGMKKLQGQSENLKEQLQKMIDQLKKGDQPVSRELSESLMMHEMMQQMLRELMNSGSLGESARKHLQDIDRMLEQNRKDLLNRNVNPQLIRRQNEILSKLLEAEKSENEKDNDNKRESDSADDRFYSNPAILFQDENNKNISIEYLEKGNIKLNNFYLDKFKNFMQKFNEGNLR